MVEQQMYQERTIHLGYGLRLSVLENQDVKLWPSDSPLVIQARDLGHQGIRTFLDSLGIKVIGVEDCLWDDESRTRIWKPAVTTELTQKAFGTMPGDVWAALAFAYGQRGQDKSAVIAKNVAFHLRGASYRLLSISESYHEALKYARKKGMSVGARFSNVEHINFLTDCHSLCVELGSARDHIARFISSVICSGPICEKHSELWKKREQFSDEIGTVLEVFGDKKSPLLNVAHISEYRNFLVHESPISGLSDSDFSVTTLNAVGSSMLLGVSFEVPERIASTKVSNSIDSLGLFYSMLLEFNRYAEKIASLSPVQPKLAHLTDEDIVSIVEMQTTYSVKGKPI